MKKTVTLDGAVKRNVWLRRSVVVAAVLVLMCGAGFGGYYWQKQRSQTEITRVNQAKDKEVGELKKKVSQLEETAQEYKQKRAMQESVPATTHPSQGGDALIPPITNGKAPVISRIETTRPVVFLGIDDGAYKDKKVVDLLKKYDVKATLFLSDMFIKDNPAFFKQITANGSIVENHTISHDTAMSTKSLDYQKREICGMNDKIKQYYGSSSYLFRPPGGAYTATTQQAAAACGARAVVNWIAKANGGSMQYQVGNSLRPGDIALMHFRPEFEQDLAAFVKARDAASLHTELLEDWINR
jgi:peptidoglycan/xylan/chitin deacetylase (PgdA/CDA1 family)